MLDYEEKFDKVVLASLAVSEEEQQEAENLVSEDLKEFAASKDEELIYF